MSVAVRDITFSIKEETPRTDNKGTSERFPGEVSDKVRSYTKNYYLIYHISFDYDDYLGDRVTGSAEVKSDPIATISYDENGLVSSTTVASLPKAEEIVSACKTKAEEVAESYNKEKVLFSKVNALLNEVNTLEGIPHERYSRTGLDQLGLI